jgi:hypothetical protein
MRAATRRPAADLPDRQLHCTARTDAIEAHPTIAGAPRIHRGVGPQRPSEYEIGRLCWPSWMRLRSAVRVDAPLHWVHAHTLIETHLEQEQR